MSPVADWIETEYATTQQYNVYVDHPECLPLPDEMSKVLSAILFLKQTRPVC